jgi:hypothetical protein
MLKPKNYDSVAASLVFEPLALGGHPCIIKAVEETKTQKTGKDMLKVALDIAEGDPQAGYYADKFANDDRENKKWPCISYIVTEDKDGNCSRNLAQFVTSVEESNPGFAFPWDNLAYLKGKKVGGVFGQEEYLNDKGEKKKATKLFWFRDVAKVKDAPVPKLREYKPAARTPASQVNSFADISEDDIPF